MTQHYIFAHRILPGLAHSDPARFKALNAGQFRALWAHAAEHATEGDTSGPERLSVEWEDELLVVTMPPPEEPPEAFFVAVHFPSESEVRYLVLELGADLDGNQTNFLCAWENKTHVQYGDGYSEDREDFLDVVRQHI